MRSLIVFAGRMLKHSFSVIFTVLCGQQLCISEEAVINERELCALYTSLWRGENAALQS